MRSGEPSAADGRGARSPRGVARAWPVPLRAPDGATAQARTAAYVRLEDEGDARVLVLTGAGGVSFCAGADLKATETFVGRLMSPEGPMGFTRLTPSKPTIAAISGFCLA